MDNNLFGEMCTDALNMENKINSQIDPRVVELSSLVSRQYELEKQVYRKEMELKDLTDTLRELSEKTIPDLFDNLGLSELKLSSGDKVTVSRFFVASISKEREKRCFDWLEKNGHDTIIKNTLEIKLQKGEVKKCETLVKYLETQQVDYTQKRNVHPQTLKAFVNEQIANGVDFPMDDFAVMPIRKTKITQKGD